jgi:hypothetical protein
MKDYQPDGAITSRVAVLWATMQYDSKDIADKLGVPEYYVVRALMAERAKRRMDEVAK